MGDHPDRQFDEPLASTFVYAAWSIDPVRVGPFVRPSRARRAWIDREFHDVVGNLTQRPDIEQLRVFEASFIPPLPGIPHYDVVTLVRAHTRSDAENVRRYLRAKGREPVALFLASNAARFGDTESPRFGVNILLNHFTGPPDHSAAAECWRKISRWYAAKTGIDNSTLLCADPDAPYALVNYARIPGAVVSFMLQMLLRPSFYRDVRAVLEQNGLMSFPLFVRNLPIGAP